MEKNRIDFILKRGYTAEDWRVELYDSEKQRLRLRDSAFSLKIFYPDGECLEERTLGNGLSLSDDFTLSIDRQKRVTLPRDSYAYTLEMQIKNDVYPLFKGILKVE